LHARAQAAERGFVEQHARPMAFGDGLTIASPRPLPGFVGLGAAIEAVEDALPVFGGNSRARVADFDEGAAASSPTATSTRPPAGCSEWRCRPGC
jgi:hypothetical protein